MNLFKRVFHQRTKQQQKREQQHQQQQQQQQQQHPAAAFASETLGAPTASPGAGKGDEEDCYEPLHF
ncbi:hypothetical protein Emag_005227 [Eimeria magna]